MMNADQFEGRIRRWRGRGRTALGAVAGRAHPQFEGAYDQMAGAAQLEYGRARGRADRLVREARGFKDAARDRGIAIRRRIDARASVKTAAMLGLAGAAAAFGLGLLISRRR